MFRCHLLPVPAALRRLVAGTASLLPGLAFANPTGGHVVAGGVTIHSPSSQGLVVDQNTSSAIVNWQSFSVGGNEFVQFVQPSSSAVILNRVVGNSPSEIFGQLLANGRVFLINPQGVLFGPSARVDVGGLVASTIDIRNEDFLAGRYVFGDAGAPGASVVNDGLVTADNGFVVLAGDYVKNTGVIRAQLGEVLLASGSALTLDVTGEGLVDYSIDRSALSAHAGAHNVGQILADGGRVIMTAEVQHELVQTAVNNSGLIRAQGVEEHDGHIDLIAGGGDIVDSGTIEASNAAGDGGSVRIAGDRDIDIVDGAIVDASGASTGGEVRIVADGTLHTRAGSLIDVHARDAGGTGGFTELSGHGALTVRGDLRIGRGGTLLIDPTTLTIADGSGTSGSSGGNETIFEQAIESQLRSFVNVQLVATDSITLSNLTDGVLDGRAGSGFGGGLLLGIGTVGSGGAFVRGAGVAGGGIKFANTSNTIAVGGLLQLVAGSVAGAIDVGNLVGGQVALTGNGGITAGNISSGFGSIVVNATSGNIVVGNLDASGFGRPSGADRVSVVSDKGSVTVGTVTSVSNSEGAADSSVLISAATGITVGAITVSANGSFGNADASVRLTADSGVINVAGPILTAATASASASAADASVTIADGHLDALAVGVSIGDVGTSVTGGLSRVSDINIDTRLTASGGPAGDVTTVGSSRVDLQACKLEYSIVSPK